MPIGQGQVISRNVYRPLNEVAFEIKAELSIDADGVDTISGKAQKKTHARKVSETR